MSLRVATAAACLLVVAIGVGCASAPVRPVPGGEAESYVAPTPQPGELDPGELRRFEEAWSSLENGHWSEASKKLRRLTRTRMPRPAVATASAYCVLRSGRYEEAQRLFDAVLSTHVPSPSALVGAALSATRRGRRDEALDLLRRASVAAPDDAIVRRLYAETRVLLTEAWVSDARTALEQGDIDTAIQAYDRTLAVAPEVAGVRLELAEAFLSRALPVRAAEVLSADPTSDRALLLRLGQVLQGLQEFDRALAVYQGLLRRFPTDNEARRGLAETLRSKELLSLPEELRRLPSAPRATRADLAALLILRVAPLAGLPPGEPEVAVDISGSWAREQIVRSLALRILDVFPNHSFQPGGGVRRGELAMAIAHVLDLLGIDSPSRPVLPDVPRNSPQYDAASRVVGLGLMETAAQGGFEPWRVVSGREAWDVVEALSRRRSPGPEPAPAP